MTACSGTVYFFDKLSKHIVSSFLAEGESVAIAENFFHLTLVHNTGGAFGIMRGRPHIFTAAAMIFIPAALFYTVSKWHIMPRIEKIAISFIAGGALGNLTDRLRYGYVIDFIDLRVWPVFNIADSFITVGTLMLIVSLLISPQNRNKETRCTG